MNPIDELHKLHRRAVRGGITASRNPEERKWFADATRYLELLAARNGAYAPCWVAGWDLSEPAQSVIDDLITRGKTLTLP
jgi:hypothetical protein